MVIKPVFLCQKIKWNLFYERASYILHKKYAFFFSHVIALKHYCVVQDIRKRPSWHPPASRTRRAITNEFVAWICLHLKVSTVTNKYMHVVPSLLFPVKAGECLLSEAAGCMFWNPTTTAATSYTWSQYAPKTIPKHKKNYTSSASKENFEGKKKSDAENERLLSTGKIVWSIGLGWFKSMFQN